MVLGPSESKLQGGKGQPTSVLIVDDHPVVREGLKVLIAHRDIRVVGEAATGRQALEEARRLRPDVVLMDIRLPDIDGLTVTEHIKRELPRTAVIIVTSFDDPQYVQRALLAGASGYLLKGMPRDAYIEAIRAVRAGTSIFDASVMPQLLRGAVTTPDPQAQAMVASLDEREREVLRLLAQGLTNKEIAERIHYSVGTVKNVVATIIEKLGVSDRTQAAVVAARACLLAEDREGQSTP